MKMALAFLFLFSSTWVPNYEDVETKVKTLWYTFSLVKEKSLHNYTSELFR